MYMYLLLLHSLSLKHIRFHEIISKSQPGSWIVYSIWFSSGVLFKEQQINMQYDFANQYAIQRIRKTNGNILLHFANLSISGVI